jgi:hypothetical protein
VLSLHQPFVKHENVIGVTLDLERSRAEDLTRYGEIPGVIVHLDLTVTDADAGHICRQLPFRPNLKPAAAR